MIKINLFSNYVDEVIGEYYAVKGYLVYSVDCQVNG